MFDDITIQLLSKGLDASYLKQMAVASNITHRNVKNYQPQTVNFEEQLNTLRHLLTNHVNERELNTAIEALHPALIKDSSQTTVHLDTEMINQSKNAVEYQSLTKMLQKHFALLDESINGGKDR